MRHLPFVLLAACGTSDPTPPPQTGAVSLDVTSFGVVVPVGAAAARIAPGGSKRSTSWTEDFPYKLSPYRATTKWKGKIALSETQCLGRDAEGNPLVIDELLKTCKPV